MKQKLKNSKGSEINGSSLSRRRFISLTGTAALSAAIVPRYVLGGPGYTPPSDKLNIAMIGTGGQGMQNLRNLLIEKDVQIVALADVAEVNDYSETYHQIPGGRKPGYDRIKEAYENDPQRKDTPDCAVYIDFRRMLDQEKEIDAVFVSIPDHSHAIATLAVINHGKHVYCEKPLARTIYETRIVTNAARKAGVVTQMGNQGHGDEGLRLTYEWIRDGAIGNVTEVHAWSAGTNMAACRDNLSKGNIPVPEGLDWQLWLGPLEYRPYDPYYIPCRWRDFLDMSTGRIGDMGCHNMDPAFFALDLGYPEWVQARSAWGDHDKKPFASTVLYQFPARGPMPPVKMTWYSGLMPARPEELEEGRDLSGDGNGILFIGDKGKIMCPGWAGSPRIIPETKMKEYKLPPKSLKRVGGIYRDFINACKTGTQASSHFDYSGPMTEVILMGLIAMRTDEKLYWDGPNMKVTNHEPANAYVRPEYHNGWVLG